MSAETVKIESRYLAGTIGEELADAELDAFEDDAELLLKFHGIYQQDDRDVRRARTQLKLPLDYSCMVRASVPGGVISPTQWLALDRISALADNKLRLTTRQGVQYHVVHKGELHQLVAGINSAGADHARRVRRRRAQRDGVPAAPRAHRGPRAAARRIVARFRPQTESYWELWVDGEKAVTAEPGRPAPPAPTRVLAPIDDVEPIYGTAYLPRKFKIGVAWPGDNCVDLYTNDVGLVPTLSDGTTGDLTGFAVFAGGGLGMSHSRPDDTYPLLASASAGCPPRRARLRVVDVDRGDRHHAARPRQPRRPFSGPA